MNNKIYDTLKYLPTDTTFDRFIKGAKDHINRGSTDVGGSVSERAVVAAFIIDSENADKILSAADFSKLKTALDNWLAKRLQSKVSGLYNKLTKR